MRTGIQDLSEKKDLYDILKDFLEKKDFCIGARDFFDKIAHLLGPKIRKIDGKGAVWKRKWTIALKMADGIFCDDALRHIEFLSI